jgi:formiminoglutamase
MSWTKAPPSLIFFAKNDPQDPRLGEWAQSLSIKDLAALETHLAGFPERSWTVLGYPDDEGVAMNGGRPGAGGAPDLIRQMFYKMTPSLLNPSKKNLFDLGNIQTTTSLSERHERGRQVTQTVLAHGHRTFSLGGGHDYGYADGAGFLDHCQALGQRGVLLNFDAHLDVRPSDRGYHSGTSFRRLLTKYAGTFDFVEIGLQNQCNSAEHLKWAQAQGTTTILLEDIRSFGLSALMQPLLATLAGRPCFVSVDIDAFTSSEAPGCSQSWACGLTYAEFSPVLRQIQQSLNVLGLGIYEVAPALDVDRITSKLAALILHQTLFT